MDSLYPLRFEPLFRRYIWGGRRLETDLGKAIPQGDDYAESWEVVDHGKDQSVVVDGSLAGWTLTRLVKERGQDLLGRHHPQLRFPLLFKFLDCQRILSVQVHPNDEQAASLKPPDLGKTEAWVILARKPGSLLYAGLQPGVDRTIFERALLNNEAERCLHAIEPLVGDCIFIPAGTVHALGEGLVVAELQQSSDTTFRLYDWNRLGTDGQPRPLHLQQGLEVIDFQRGPIEPRKPQATDRPHVERLAACDQFVVDRWRIAGPNQIGRDDRCHILAVIAGQARIDGIEMRRGETVLMPAVCSPQVIESPNGVATILDMYLP